MVKYVESTAEFEELILKKSLEKLVVVDFTATWCPPCRMIGPHFETLAEETPEAIFVKVDVDDQAEIAASAGIEAMPTFQFFKGGKKVKGFAGADIGQLKSITNQLK
mmetsp:Transcript_7616/g.15667  ORF Transcript_7616/g.15667 Transcript_7616/m.15667 type:complete len:107 (-) Transcript_7616:282-602(-)|eukprot:CAMPEP_0201135500 /NCGR_PEP_ID=MMETSP0850-20130426/54348_1 /ASSEMBLY_ACC=CAM_ASM_000622 /TAXON_ID=183588 /ORGANISM="Pseudo-nitzschia fraudulenta, Strain WWA7" /LENGTH=106 /DNA_ID=CAMNT_0047406669 /DNA_START=84 /DNA_END=404 /DNA_ORIENTATION=+